jgi:Flp pilus assembly pilin Flp
MVPLTAHAAAMVLRRLIPDSARNGLLGLRRLLGHRDGATAIEYALMAAIVSIVAMAGVQAFAGSMDRMYNVVLVVIADALAGS